MYAKAYVEHRLVALADGGRLSMVVTYVSAAFRFTFCRSAVLPFWQYTRFINLCFPFSVLPSWPTHRFEANVFRFAGHAKVVAWCRITTSALNSQVPGARLF